MRPGHRGGPGYRIGEPDPATQQFIAEVKDTEGLPFSGRTPDSIRASLTALQSKPTGRRNALLDDLTIPGGPAGSVGVRVIRPKDSSGTLPVVMYFHGGGWVAGDVHTHDRIVREIAVSVHAAVVFVSFGRSPEAQFPHALQEAYVATKFVSDHGDHLDLDGSRLAVVGDGTGGNIAAALTILSKQNRGPKIDFQVLFCPVTSVDFTRPSCKCFGSNAWLTQRDLRWLWNAYLPSAVARTDPTATPLNATIDQLRGLPAALVITAEIDFLRDDGEAYARKLAAAHVRTTCTRYMGAIHDFVVLNALADTPAARSAVEQAVTALREALV